MPGGTAHLVARFFDVALSRPLQASERNEVAEWLSPELRRLFFAQPPADQRHGYRAAQVVLASGIEDPAVLVTALLHDVGKRHARLGLIGRSLASVLIKLRLPLPAAARKYRDHGVLGAHDLAASGAPALAVDYAMHHHGPRPETIDRNVWRVLDTADQPAKPGEWLRRRITSASR